MDIRNLYLRKLMQFYERKRSKLRSSVAMVLAVSMALSLCTTNVFALAAESGAKGERHKHNFTCRELICEEEHEDGEHTKECFAESGPWLCGLEEGEYHIHNHDGYDCWVMAKELDCKATKSDADKETEEGADEEEWTASGSNATRSNAKRSKTGGKRHVHTDECYKEVYECRPAQEIRLMTLRNGEIGTDLEAAIENAISEGEGTLVLENDYEVSSLITIDKDLTIDLNGKTITYGSEESAEGKVFLTVKGAELTIQDDSGEGKIIGNAEKLDALIRVQDGGTLTVEGGTFESGGIRSIIAEGGTVEMTGGCITNSGVLDTNSQIGSSGGGVLLSGSEFTMSGGSIEGNRGRLGGGIYAKDNSTVKINGNAKISDNEAAVNGGGIYVRMGSSLTVEGKAVISGNTAKEGGAVYGEAPCTVEIKGSVTVEGNESTNGGKAVAGTGTLIGVLDNQQTNILKNNIVVSGEKAPYVINKPVVIDLGGHTITYTGDANKPLFCIVRGGSLTIQNEASNEMVATGEGISGQGGIVSSVSGLDCLIKVEDGGELTIGGGTFENKNGVRAFFSSGNDAVISMTGGKITNCGNSEAWGGGILVAGGSTFNMTGGEITGNRANYGAVAVSSSYANIGGQAKITKNEGNHGGGISAYGTSELTVEKEAVISGNMAKLGGGVYVTNSTVNINGSAGISDNGATVNGGGIYADSSTVTISGDTKIFGKNKAADCGGGVYATGKSTVNINGSAEISGNEATVSGGGIYANDSSTVTISGDAKIFGNEAADCGGGICALGTSTVMVSGDAVISKNTANGITKQGETIAIHGVKYGKHYGGGGIFGEINTTITLEENCKITENYSKATAQEGRGGGYNGGGGIFSLGKVYMKGGTVSSNKATDSGGGIYSAGGESYFEMTGGIIEKNIADQDEGGGLRVDGKGLITEGIIEKNTTNTTFDWGGGGIFVNSGGKLTIENLLVTNNTAAGFGGGVGGCSTGDVKLFDLKGAAVYGNYAKESGLESEEGLTQRLVSKMDDHKMVEAPISDVFKNGYRDFYCAGVSTVYGDMLGGGDANWIGSYYGPEKGGADNPFDLSNADWGTIEISSGSSKTAKGWMALTARPTETDITNAREDAQVIISENTSATHGGGIMSNGTLILGEDPGKSEEKGSLIISKVANNFPSGTSFKFTVTLKDSNDNPLTGKLPFKKFKSSSGEAGATREETLDLDNGSAEIQLENGQSLKIWKLPVGAKYTVTETGANVDYKTEVKGDITEVKEDNNNPVVSGGEGSIKGNQSSSITFTNTPYTGQLEISKTVVSSGELTEENKTDEFTFTIKLTGKNGSPLEGTYPYTRSAEAGSAVPPGGNCTFTGGEAEIILTHGQKVIFSEIPAGTQYTVSEKPQNGYSPENGTGIATGEIKKDSTESVNIKNIVAATGSLEIGKTVIGAGNANDDKFTFEVKLTGKGGAPLTGSFLCVGSSTAEGVAPPQDQALILNEESGGIFTFTLMHGQKITVSGLPMETNYQVEEKHYDGYTPQIPGNAQGSITEENADIAVGFINHMDTGSLSIQKTVTGKEGDKAKPFTFTITLTKDGKPLSGTYLYSGSAVEEGVEEPEPGSCTFDANGEAKISLAHGQKVTFSGIPAGTSYRVTEAEANQGGYETTETGTAGTVVKDGESTAKFVNNRPDTPEETTTETETEPTTEPETTETEPSTSETEPTTEPSTSETEPTTEPSTSETEPATEPSTTPEESSPTEEPTTPEETTPAESSPTEEATTPEETTPAESPENPTTPSRPSGGGGGGGGRDRDRNPSVTPETTPIPPEEVPLANIDPEDVPLAMMPSDSPDETTVILDENVPLFGLPKTGDRSVPAGALFGTMLLSLMAACGIHMKKRKEK